MDENTESVLDISTESANMSYLSLFNLLNNDRDNLLRELRHRVHRLKEIVDEKLKQRMPITPSEDACLLRYSYVLEEDDAIKINADETINKILQAVNSHDEKSLENIPLLPKNEELPVATNEELKLETLISDYIQNPRREFTKEDFRNLRIADIIAVVETESGKSKVSKKNKRKPSRSKVTAKQPPSKKKKPHNVLYNFPPQLMQYIRGFFNVLRLILLNMTDPEDGISTDQMCQLVRAWSSDHRVRRINSTWISRCEDWSEFVRPALSFLAGKNSNIVLASSPNFVQFNSATRSWHWLGYRGTARSEDPIGATESEITVLARLFSLWARRNGLSSSTPGGSRRQRSIPPSSQNEIEPDDEEEEGNDSSDNAGEQEAPATTTAKSRRRQVKPEQVPPPYYTTDWQCALSTPEQRRQFQEQEEKRYAMPWAPFVYNQHGYASVVAPVFRDGSGSRMRAALSARDHPLLRNDRPPWVSISEIVRDAVARLPNGEGTRPEIAMLVQDSGFLVASFNVKQLNQCISSALDRLQSEGENSPVMYDSAQRLWIYRFRHLSAKEFFRMYKEQSEFQRERFQQIYPRGCVVGGGSAGQRASSTLRGSRGVPIGVVPHRHSVAMDIGDMNEVDVDSIPDIDDLTREDHRESDEESMSADENDDGVQSYSESEIDTSDARNVQQYHHRRKFNPSQFRNSQHLPFPPNIY